MVTDRRAWSDKPAHRPADDRAGFVPSLALPGRSEGLRRGLYSAQTAFLKTPTAPEEAAWLEGGQPRAGGSSLERSFEGKRITVTAFDLEQAVACAEWRACLEQLEELE